MRGWVEYNSELNGGEKLDLLSNSNTCDGPPILDEEVIDAIKHFQEEKTMGSDKISVSLHRFDVNIVTELLNDIYNSGPNDLLKSTFIPCPKTSGARICEDSCRVTKLLLKVIIRGRINHSIIMDM